MDYLPKSHQIQFIRLDSTWHAAPIRVEIQEQDGSAAWHSVHTGDVINVMVWPCIVESQEGPIEAANLIENVGTGHARLYKRVPMKFFTFLEESINQTP